MILSKYLVHCEMKYLRDKWKFEAKLDDFDSLPVFQFLLEQVLFGHCLNRITGQWNADAHKTVDVSSQVLFFLHNVKTDCQVKHNSKNDIGLLKEPKHLCHQVYLLLFTRKLLIRVDLPFV